MVLRGGGNGNAATSKVEAKDVGGANDDVLHWFNSLVFVCNRVIGIQ